MTSREAEGSRGPRVQRMAVREEQRAVWGEQRRAGGGGSANPGGAGSEQRREATTAGGDGASSRDGVGDWGRSWCLL
jgi:hypothetical protein